MHMLWKIDMGFFKGQFSIGLQVKKIILTKTNCSERGF